MPPLGSSLPGHVCKLWLQHGIRLRDHREGEAQLFAIMKQLAASIETSPLTMVSCETIRSQEVLEAYWKPLHGSARQTQLLHDSASLCAGERDGFMPATVLLVHRGPPSLLKVLRIEGPERQIIYWLQKSVTQYARSVESSDDIPLELIKALMIVSPHGDSIFAAFPGITNKSAALDHIFDLYPEFTDNPGARTAHWLHHVFDLQTLNNIRDYDPLSEDEEPQSHRNGHQEASDIFRLSQDIDPESSPEIILRSRGGGGDPPQQYKTHNAYAVTAGAFSVMAYILSAHDKDLAQRAATRRMSCLQCGVTISPHRSFHNRWQDVLKSMKRLKQLVADHKLREAPLSKPCWGCGFLQAMARAVVSMLTNTQDTWLIYHENEFHVGRLLLEAVAFCRPIKRWMQRQMLQGVSSPQAGMPFAMYPCRVCTCQSAKASAQLKCQLHTAMTSSAVASDHAARSADIVVIYFHDLPGITLDHALETTRHVLLNWYARQGRLTSGRSFVVEATDDRMGLIVGRELWERVVADSILRTSGLSNSTRESCSLHSCLVWSEKHFAYAEGTLRRGLDAFTYTTLGTPETQKGHDRRSRGRLYHSAQGGSYHEAYSYKDAYLPWTYIGKQLKETRTSIQGRVSTAEIVPLRCLHMHSMVTWPLALRSFLYETENIMPAACGWLRRHLYGNLSPTGNSDLFGSQFAWRSSRMLVFLLRRAVGQKDDVLGELLRPFTGQEGMDLVSPAADESGNLYGAVWAMMHPWAPYLRLTMACVQAIQSINSRLPTELLRVGGSGSGTLVLPNSLLCQKGDKDKVRSLIATSCITADGGLRAPLHYLFYHLALAPSTTPQQARDIFYGISVSWNDDSIPSAAAAADQVEPPHGPPTHYTFVNTHPMCSLKHGLNLYRSYAQTTLQNPRYSVNNINAPGAVSYQQQQQQTSWPRVAFSGTTPAKRTNPLTTPKNFLTLEELHRHRQQKRPFQSTGRLVDEMVHDWYACSLGPGEVLEESHYESIEALFAGLEILGHFSARPSDQPDHPDRLTECTTKFDSYLEQTRSDQIRRKKRKRTNQYDTNRPSKRRRQCQDADEDEDSDPETEIQLDFDFGDDNGLPNGCNYQPADFDQLSLLTEDEQRHEDGATARPVIEAYELTLATPFVPSTWSQSRYTRRLTRLILGGQCGHETPIPTTPAPKRIDPEPSIQWAKHLTSSLKWMGLPESELRCYRGLLQPYQVRQLYSFPQSRSLIDRSPEFSHCAPLPLLYSDFGAYVPDGESTVPPDQLHFPDQLFPLWHTQWRPAEADHIFLRHVVNVQGDLAPFLQCHPQLLSAILNYTITEADLVPGSVPVDETLRKTLVRLELEDDQDWRDLCTKVLGLGFDTYGTMFNKGVRV